MKKWDILKEVFSEKQRRWDCYQMNAPKSEREISKTKATEMCKDVKHSKKKDENIKPKMKKGDLVEYVNKNKTQLRENHNFELPIIKFANREEKSEILNYVEAIRRSGLINMVMAYYIPGSETAPSQILVWEKDELHRFLYGKKMDPEYLKKSSSNDMYFDDEEEYEEEEEETDGDSELLNTINYLLDNKNKIRDILINLTIRQLPEDFDYDNMKLFNRKFSDTANDAIKMYFMVKGYH